MSDRPTHPARLFVNGSHGGLDVTCPHDEGDKTRPCWPRTDGKPDPAPQTVCTIVDWLQALDCDDLLDDSAVDGVVTWEWQGDDGPLLKFSAARSLPPEWERLRAEVKALEVAAYEGYGSESIIEGDAFRSVLDLMDAIAAEAEA